MLHRYLLGYIVLPSRFCFFAKKFNRKVRGAYAECTKIISNSAAFALSSCSLRLNCSLISLCQTPGFLHQRM